jgi:hypothetical protein
MGDIYQGGRDAAEYYFFWGQKLKPLVTKYKFVRKLSKRIRLYLKTADRSLGYVRYSTIQLLDSLPRKNSWEEE